MSLDDTDLRIIEQLQQNGRSSNREVARQLGISEGTVRQRLKRLEEAKLMRLGVVSDARALGQVSSAFVRIRAEPRHARSIAETIAAFPCCSFAGLTLGRFDIIALLGTTSRAELIEVIDQQIAAMRGVLMVDVREPIGFTKHRFDLIHIP